MAVHSRNKGRNRVWLVVNSILFLLILYFTYHSLNGERGLLQYLRLRKQVNESEIMLDKLRQERVQLESKVQLLSSKNLNLDMLDEQTRQVLGYVKSDEKILYLNK